MFLINLRLRIRDKIVFPSKFKRNYKTKTAMSKSYEEMVNCINSLQSNQTYIQNAVSKGILRHSALFSTTIAETQKYLLRTGVSLDELDKLSIIHVAGTKGKGSTSAFCESILRAYGYKTGFYSSPHLVSIRERIRLNGKLITKELFAENAFRIYNRLMDTRDHPDDMPAYFRFLTILAFNVFLQAKIDVAVIEVGIGGEYDCTNIVRNTPIVGITSLGIDHTNLLGNTIEEIAWQKAGIMKTASKVFTVHQINSAMNVLKERSVEKKCNLEIVPEFEEYLWNNTIPILGINGDIQKINVSLAIQLAYNWMKLTEHCNGIKSEFENKLSIPQKTRNGLQNCKWPGRNQILKKDNHTFYLDGAHTIDSLKICVNWFKRVSFENTYKSLIFNTTGDRNSENLLKQLVSIKLNSVIFVPNIASSTRIADQVNMSVTNDQQLKRCELHKNIWLKFQDSSNSLQKVTVCSSVENAVETLPNNKQTEILITGSLHLIGAALGILDPEFQTF